MVIEFQSAMNVLLSVICLLSIGVVEQDSAALVTYDRTCPTECLQTNQPYFTHGLKPFHLNCTVGNLAEVKNFRESYMKRITDILQPFDTPKLVGIEFYHKWFQSGNTEGALNISFQLPERKTAIFKNNTKNKFYYYRFGKYKYPPAVLLHFQSVDDLIYRDEFYYHNPRERIFRIWDPTSGPVTKRICIYYDCMVGLNDSEPVRAYRIVLESAFGKDVTYYCTVPVQQGLGYITVWRPAIATSFNPLKGTLHVVFSEFKRPIKFIDNLREISYSIVLLKDDGTVVKSLKELNPTDFEILFKLHENGIYIVEVEKCEINYNGKFLNCISTTSIGTEVTSVIVTNFYKDPIEENVLIITVSLTVVAVLLSVIATLLIYFICVKKKKQIQRPPALYPLERRGGQNNETRESLTLRYTNTIVTQQMERDSQILDAASINDTHETDIEKDNNSDNKSNTYSNIAHLESATSAGYDFYMNAFIEINASRSTICSSDLRAQETFNEIAHKHDNRSTSDNSLPSETEHLTYDDCMERFILINTSSTSSDGFASSSETL